MSGDTRGKLSEAEYFLERMRESQSDRDVFRYNLSAFLAASRSVTLFAQKEFKRSPGFEEWYEQKQAEMRQDPAMGHFLDARNIMLHRQHVATRSHIQIGLAAQVGVTATLGMVVIRSDGTREPPPVQETNQTAETPPEPAETEATVEWRWFFSDLPEGVADKDVVALSEDHIVKLRAFVTECENRFGS